MTRDKDKHFLSPTKMNASAAFAGAAGLIAMYAPVWLGINDSDAQKHLQFVERMSGSNKGCSDRHSAVVSWRNIEVAKLERWQSMPWYWRLVSAPSYPEPPRY